MIGCHYRAPLLRRTGGALRGVPGWRHPPHREPRGNSDSNNPPVCSTASGPHVGRKATASQLANCKGFGCGWGASWPEVSIPPHRQKRQPRFESRMLRPCESTNDSCAGIPRATPRHGSANRAEPCGAGHDAKEARRSESGLTCRL
eukprot:2097203-Alexandrium_andersonii.AAC.1